MNKTLKIILIIVASLVGVYLVLQIVAAVWALNLANRTINDMRDTVTQEATPVVEPEETSFEEFMAEADSILQRQLEQIGAR